MENPQSSEIQKSLLASQSNSSSNESALPPSSTIEQSEASLFQPKGKSAFLKSEQKITMTESMKINARTSSIKWKSTSVYQHVVKESIKVPEGEGYSFIGTVFSLMEGFICLGICTCQEAL